MRVTCSPYLVTTGLQLNGRCLLWPPNKKNLQIQCLSHYTAMHTNLCFTNQELSFRLLSLVSTSVMSCIRARRSSSAYGAVVFNRFFQECMFSWTWIWTSPYEFCFYFLILTALHTAVSFHTQWPIFAYLCLSADCLTFAANISPSEMDGWTAESNVCSLLLSVVGFMLILRLFKGIQVYCTDFQLQGDHFPLQKQRTGWHFTEISTIWAKP